MTFFAKKQAIRTAKGQNRSLRNIDQLHRSHTEFVNCSSNDYLGIAATPTYSAAFFKQATTDDLRLSAVSSRLLTGHTDQGEQLEHVLAELYDRPAALSFVSGYHANSGIIPAITDKQTLILADKLVHASIIEGIQLSRATTIRFRHNDLLQVKLLLAKHAANFERILLITESIFSMDGDSAPLKEYVALKCDYPHLALYIDEAHSVGLYGSKGLGLAEEWGIIDQIDYLVGTMGKALASSGAYIVCENAVKDHLINTCRTFIYTTAPAPINQAWSTFVLQQLASMQTQRDHLQQISLRVRNFLLQKNKPTQSISQIIPIHIGDNHECMEIATKLQQQGIHVLPVRPPTVPEGTARLRLSLCASLRNKDIDTLLHALDQVL